MNYSTSSMLKAKAKEQIFSNLGTVIGAFLVSFLLISVLEYFLSYLIPGNLMAGVLTTTIISIVVGFITAIFTQGENMICLKLSCGQDVEVKDIFYGFGGGGKDVPKILGLRVIPVVVTELATIPVLFLQNRIIIEMNNIGILDLSATSFSDIFRTTSDGSVLEDLAAKITALIPLEMAYLGFLLLELIIMAIVEIMFSQVLLLSLDFPDKSTGEIIKLGFKIMKGNWGRYFLLQLSFIPWHLLAVITMGIAYVWVHPYKRATYANFYLDLMEKQKTDN